MRAGGSAATSRWGDEARIGLRAMLGINVFWVGLSALSDGLTTLVLPYQMNLVASDASRATALGLVSFVGLFAAMLAQPAAGSYSDWLRPRLRRRGWIGISSLGILIALFGLAYAGSLITVAVMFVLVQLSLSSAQAGQQGLIPDLVPILRRGVAAGWKGLADVGGATIGFVVFGSLLESGGVAPAILAVGALLTFSYLLMVVLVREEAVAEDFKAEVGSRFRLSAIYRIALPRDLVFVRLTAARFLFLLGIFGVGRFLFFFVDERLGLGAGEAGALLGLLALLTVATSVPFGRLADRLGRVVVMRIGIALAAIGVSFFIPAKSVAVVVVGGSLMSFGSAAFSAANWAATTDVVPRHDSARLMGLANVGAAGASAAAGLFGPLIDSADRIFEGSGFPVLFSAAIVSVVAAALTLRRVRENKPGLLKLSAR